MNLLKNVVLLFLLIFGADCAKILALFHFPSKSHHILGKALLKHLALKRGHEVTLITPFLDETNIPNYREIKLEGVVKYKEEVFENLFSTGIKGIYKKASTTMNYFYNLSNMTLNSTAVQNILISNTKYDLLIMEMFYNEAFLGLANQINARVVIFNPIGSTPQLDRLTGNTSPLSYVPNLLMPYTGEMNFIQRTINVLTTIFFDVFSKYSARQHEIYKRYFPRAPPLDFLEKELVDLVLVNSHYSNESPRPYVPNVVPIGGFHLEDSKGISGDLKTFLDSAKNGVIFFSFGSNLKISALPEEKREVLLEVFKKLTLNVLMVSDISLGDLPKNIKVEKWLPQNGILAHPNVKLFISHGGFGSTTEAMYHGVPIIGIPFFGDQSKNVADCVRKGFAILLELSDISKEKLQAAINEVLHNPKYRNNLKKVSSLLKDQPIKPMDNAIFWIEHIIRHNGGAHLKNSGVKLAWYQYFLLDVIAFITATCILTIILVYLSCSTCFKCTKNKIISKLKRD